MKFWNEKPTNSLILFLFFAGLLFVAGSCENATNSNSFVLPEGDVVFGKMAFQDFKCNSCHSIAEITRIGTEELPNVPLGGRTTELKTYEELVTSVINPSHKISQTYLDGIQDGLGQSRMEVYNNVMTVQELIDIVAFLQSEYKMAIPDDAYHYPHYE